MLLCKTNLCNWAEHKVYQGMLISVASVFVDSDFAFTLILHRGRVSRQFVSRSAEGLQLLHRVAVAGGVVSDDQGLHLTPETPGLRELLASGHVVPMKLLGQTNHDNYTMSQKGRDCVHQCYKLHSPTSLMAYAREGLSDETLEDRTTAELISILTAAGWSDQNGKCRKPPYTQNSTKVWYWSPGVKISKLYLQVLASSPQILSVAQDIHHGQPQAYYRALLSGFAALPNQPLTYYKLLMGKPPKESGSTRDIFSSADLCMMDGDVRI